MQMVEQRSKCNRLTAVLQCRLSEISLCIGSHVG